MQGRNNLGGTNIEEFIKGITEELKAQGVVNAGDFVRFLSDYSETNEIKDTAINTTLTQSDVISAVALSENKVFIAYGTIADNTAANFRKLYGVVVTISGTAITIGTSTQLSLENLAGNVISAVVLNENKVFIANYGSGKLFGMVCIISGTSITKGTNTQLSSDTYSSQVISAVKLNEGKVFITYSYGSNYYLYGMVCTISGTTITKGTETKLCSDARDSGSEISVAVLDSSKVFIAFSHYVNSTLLYSIVCTINGTTITKGTANGINITIPPSLSVSAVALSSNKVFVAFSYNNSYSLGGVICIVDGTTITGGTVYALNSATNTGKVISAVVLSENKVNVLHSDSSNRLKSMLCDIDNSVIAIGTDNQVTTTISAGETISAVALNDRDIFIAHSGDANNYLYGMVLGYLENLVKTITSSTEKIGGIAITSGTAGQTVSIKKPNV